MNQFDKLLLEITKKQMNAIDAKWRKGKQELTDTIAKHERGEISYSMDDLPVIIDGDGEYTTRDGRKVTIQQFKPNSKGHIFGHIWQKGKYGKLFRRTRTWHKSGRSEYVEETPTDVVKKGYEHSAEYINEYGIKRDWLIPYKITNIIPDDDGPNRYSWDAYSKDQKHGRDRVLEDATAEEAKAFAKENGLEVKPSSILF